MLRRTAIAGLAGAAAAVVLGETPAVARLVRRGLHPCRDQDAASHRADARHPAGQRAVNGLFPILTMQEVINLVRAEGRRRGRRVGIAPDVKRPTYYRSLGLPIEERFVQLLRYNRLLHLPLVQLIDAVGKPYDFVVSGDPRTFRDLVTLEGLRFVRGYADVASVNKDLIIPRDATAHLLQPTTLVRDAHRAGLGVHAFRFANENTFLPADFRIGTDPAAHGDFAAEYHRFFEQDIDGVVTDFPDAAVAARRNSDEEAA